MAVLDKLPNPVRAGVVTSVVVFLSLFIPSLTGWLNAFVDALSEGGTMPDLSVLGQAAASAGIAAFSGFINWAYRASQTALGVGKPPTYEVPQYDLPDPEGDPGEE